jgi:hypothetical protein
MLRHILLKPILVGAAVGATLFLFAFVFKFLLLALAVGLLWRLFAWRRWHHGQAYFGGFRPQWADRIRSMSDEEYRHFRQHIHTIPTL